MGKSRDIAPGDLLCLKKDLLKPIGSNKLVVRGNDWFSSEYALIEKGNIFTTISIQFDQVKIKKSSRVRKLISRTETFYVITLMSVIGEFFTMHLNSKRLKDVWAIQQ